MTYFFGLVLCAFLAALSWTDLRDYRLPDILTLPLIFLGFVQAWTLDLDWRASLIGAVAGYLVFFIIEHIYKRLRGRDGLGRGDAKLLAAGGAWCGWMGLPFIVLIGSGMGLVALLFPSMRRKTQTGVIPFGPFLALGIVLVWASVNLGGGAYPG